MEYQIPVGLKCITESNKFQRIELAVNDWDTLKQMIAGKKAFQAKEKQQMIQAGHWIGIIKLDATTIIKVDPKIKMIPLLYMMVYVQSLDANLEELFSDTETKDPWTIEQLVKAFVRELEVLIGSGR